MDAVLAWAESQQSVIQLIPDQDGGTFPMLSDCGAEPKEISRQLWAFLGPLVASDVSKTSIYKNVARHNGLEAWRKIAEPINDDKAMLLQKLLPQISNPRPAADIHGYEGALRDWQTTLRLFSEAGGREPDHETKRFAFARLLPPTY
jgi:hypothetical protein